MQTLINKPRIIKDLDRMSLEIQQQLVPELYELIFKHNISHNTSNGHKYWLVPFETDQASYMVRVPMDQFESGILGMEFEESFQEDDNLFRFHSNDDNMED